MNDEKPVKKEDIVHIKIDGISYEATSQMTVMDVAKANGIDIPTLCFHPHPALKPTGSCKLCAVEVNGKTDHPVIMLSCLLRVHDGFDIKTDTQLVKKARTKAFNKLLKMAPQSEKIRNIAIKYGIDVGPLPDGCIRCGLCIRVCREIVGAAALKMEKRNGRDYVVPVQGACIGCGTCSNICPTDAIRLEDKNNVRTISIRDEIIGRHPLEICEGCGKPFATPKFLNHIEERTSPHPHLKEHHRYCPTCAKLFSNRIKSFKNRKEQMPGH
jgi:predicted molibdopterin-dependent oxidoreductase YjgC